MHGVAQFNTLGLNTHSHMNENIKKGLLLVGIAFGMLITISPFIAFVIGVRKFLHGFDGLTSINNVSRLSTAPTEMMNGMLTYAISIKKTPPPLLCSFTK